MTNLDYKKMGNLIAQLRKEAGLTPTQLADAMDVSYVSVNQWEIGNKVCSIPNLIKLADLFHVTVDEIIEGKLHNEGSMDYLMRNYDLECFEPDELIQQRKLNRLQEYFRRCASIKSRYLQLLPKWAKDELSENEKEEFDFLGKYFWIDINVFQGKYEQPNVQDLLDGKEDLAMKECVKEFFTSIQDLPKEAHDWEQSKLLEHRFKISTQEIIQLGDADCMVAMFELCSPQYKDEQLVNAVKGEKSEDIENNNLISSLVQSGAHCVYRFWGYSHECWDEELLSHIEGKVVEDYERSNAWEYCIRPGYNLGGQTQAYDYRAEWKSMSYEAYQRSVMKKKTRYIGDLGKLKHSDPKRFYENLMNGEYDTYL